MPHPAWIGELHRRTRQGDKSAQELLHSYAAPYVTQAPCWTRCKACGEFWCLRHETHVANCACPPVEEWEVDPYVGE